MNLAKSCDVKSVYSPNTYHEVTGEYVDGTFAVTADYEFMKNKRPSYYANKQCNEGQGKEAYNNYFKKIGLPELKDVSSFDEIKDKINENKPVMFSEEGHLMLAVGYLNVPDSWGDDIVVKLRNGGNVNAKKEFFLVVHDPKRNRNRVSVVNGKNKYFSVDGGNAVYLVVSKIRNNGHRYEYICRASKENNYECILLAGAYSS